jgi:hypothetical protein
MLRVFRVGLLLASVVVTCSSLSFGQADTEMQGKIAANSVVPAVVQAVEDEIYDLGQEGKYFLIDNQGAGDSKPATISIYISTEISADGHGVAIYKLMPYGQVYRYFTVRHDGLVVLSNDPHQGFKPTGGSMLTIYMSDETVCDFIAHRSIKSSFVVDPEVSTARLAAAIKRQLKRTGFSYTQHLGTEGKRKQ